MATYSWTIDIWKWFTASGTSVMVYGTDYWDFDNRPSGNPTIYQPTTTFDLTGFQPLQFICITICNITKHWPASATSQGVRLSLWWVDWWWNITRRDYVYDTWSWNSLGTWGSQTIYLLYYWMVWDIDNEYSKYVFKIESTTWDSWAFTSSEITISNLTADVNTYTPWYIWVDGLNLCYTDAYWFKHKIAYDSNYSNNVWASNKGYIWLDDSDSLRIYYVDENGAARRTYPSIAWGWGWANAWTSNKWYMWAETSGYNWAWLAFIWPNGDKRRLMNWPPAWYV